MEGLSAVRLALWTKVVSIFTSHIFARDVDNVSRKLVGRTSPNWLLVVKEDTKTSTNSKLLRQYFCSALLGKA